MSLKCYETDLGSYFVVCDMFPVSTVNVLWATVNIWEGGAPCLLLLIAAGLRSLIPMGLLYYFQVAN